MADLAGLILTHPGLGDQAEQYGSNRSVDTSLELTAGRLEDNKAPSIYFVYSKPDFDDVHDHDANSSKIVETTDSIDFGWNCASFQGFLQDGIILFEHHYYCGTARDFNDSLSDLTPDFPEGDKDVTAFVVTKGVWALYTGTHYSGIQINVSGETEFGPGTRVNELDLPTDISVKSVKYLRDN